jgi:formylglycine-generating enzyme required for sulfatase activity/dienelactone hydrolase
MGVVYLARDASLDRDIALKFLTAHDPGARARFVREAKSASALDHPNIATIHEIGEWQGQPFIAMAYYDGETLHDRLARGLLDIDTIVSFTRQIAAGVSAAHAKHIVHRDLKPANIVVTTDETIKILDFGLAKTAAPSAETAILTTQPGTTLGTAAYMAPEQVLGGDADERADVWALGVIVYEMLTGRRPFDGENAFAVMHAIATVVPPPVSSLRRDAPVELVRFVDGALAKEANHRNVTAASVAAEHAPHFNQVGRGLAQSRRRLRWTTAAVLAAVVLALAALSTTWWSRANRIAWARDVAPLDIRRFADNDEYVAAYDEAVRAEAIIPNHPGLAKLWPIVAREATVNSQPPGADVYFREYGGPADQPWRLLGKTPLIDVRYPRGFFDWKIQLPGYAEVLDVGPAAPFIPMVAMYTLEASADRPEGMVRVSAGGEPFQMSFPGLEHLPAVQLDDYWLDQHEVTNREFKRFVEQGGYRRDELWPSVFHDAGRTLPRAEALRRFVDATGRPGPATWESGTYPTGQDDYPVTGVSWYEASAYAAFVGKQLPTVFHWSMAAEQSTSGSVVPASNFSGNALRATVGSTARNRFGAVDMAGNAKEWVSNPADGGRRYILGGAWNEPNYMFTDGDARSPFARDTTFGFRCMKLVTPHDLSADVTRELAYPFRDYTHERPVSDEVFRHYLSFYAYDKVPLDARVEAVDDSDAEWRLERVTFAAAYGNERITAYLFLPRNRQPPYQTVMYFPGSGFIASSERSETRVRLATRNFDYLLKSGRAIMWPVYKGTFERGGGIKSDYPDTSANWRDHMVMIAKDLGRSIDYLSTRSDIAGDKIGFMGISWGGAMGGWLPAVERRLKALVLLLGGFYQQPSLPEADIFNFTSRVIAPTLMLNGRYDFFYPTQSAQEPMFALLGSPAADKRRVVYDTGHTLPRNEMIRETLDWFDKYLGPAR